jgi:tRNA1Val (adenine37-N6)-methyltransferase
MTSISGDDGLTRDAFLGGRVHVWQPVQGYRAGIDPVILAAAVAARPGQAVLELGCGAGVAALCLAARVPGLAVTGVELQPGYALLARRNAVENALPLTVIEADLAAPPPSLRARSFDHVLMNPPYFDRSLGTGSDDAGRNLALGGPTPLADWVDAATKRLRSGGWLTVIQRMARLPDLLGALDGRLGTVAVLPLAARAGRGADLFLLRARKGGRAPFRLLAPLVLHDGDRHLRDGDDFAAPVKAVLRDGAALDWGD